MKPERHFPGSVGRGEDALECRPDLLRLGSDLRRFHHRLGDFGPAAESLRDHQYLLKDRRKAGLVPTRGQNAA